MRLQPLHTSCHALLHGCCRCCFAHVHSMPAPRQRFIPLLLRATTFAPVLLRGWRAEAHDSCYEGHREVGFVGFDQHVERRPPQLGGNDIKQSAPERRCGHVQAKEHREVAGRRGCTRREGVRDASAGVHGRACKSHGCAQRVQQHGLVGAHVCMCCVVQYLVRYKLCYTARRNLACCWCRCGAATAIAAANAALALLLLQLLQGVRVQRRQLRLALVELSEVPILERSARVRLINSHSHAPPQVLHRAVLAHAFELVAGIEVVHSVLA
mmetsp:Transcript_11489/g.31340  ORF Transcript_11489/g.31340 Transcript_11489/m.31340 type:complete len:269 (-) Transcript_11489:365-1171(-)